MSYKEKKSHRFKMPEFILALMILFSGLMFGLSNGGFIINFNKVGFTVFSTMQKGVHLVADGVGKFFTSVHEIVVLEKEYKILEEKLKDYEYMQRNNAEIRKENERLKEQLGFASNYEYKNIASQIIGRDVNSIFSGITIDKGIKNGIKKGMPVIAVQNGNVGVVGKIVTVGLTTSQVMPVYDLKCNISGRIENTRDVGIVSGTGSAYSPLKMQYIRKRDAGELNFGDIVITSGENGNYMKNIPIGRISKINVLDYDSNLDIELDPVIDFARLETVLVIDQSLKNDKIPYDENKVDVR